MLREIDIEKLPSFQIGLDKGLELCLEQGRDEGREENQRKIVHTALNRGMGVEDIAALTSLSKEQILALKKQQQ